MAPSPELPLGAWGMCAGHASGLQPARKIADALKAGSDGEHVLLGFGVVYPFANGASSLGTLAPVIHIAFGDPVKACFDSEQALP